MPVTLPDSTKFDSDSDTLKESRPELKKMADAINTIGAEYNAGTLGGSAGIQEIVAGTNITVSSPDSAGSVTIDSTASGLSNVVDDTTPQLGGDLDVNGKKITSTANGDVRIEPDGNGDIVLHDDMVEVGDAATSAVVRANLFCPSLTLTKAGQTNAIRVGNDGVEFDTVDTGDAIHLNGPVKIQDTTGTPTDTTNPAKWLKIEISDSTASAGSEYYYIKLYQ
jgi:hypothetical protein